MSEEEEEEKNLTGMCEHHFKIFFSKKKGKSPTFEKSRLKDEYREDSRERAAACVRHVGHLLQYGSATGERRLHL